jgi:acyl carrier protein
MTTDEARDLLQRLLDRIAPEVDLSSSPPDAELQADLDLDSMDFLTLLSALHDESGIDVPERDYSRVATIDGFAEYVAALTD